jgi:anthranilate/para-aminobenzoate synthase component II
VNYFGILFSHEEECNFVITGEWIEMKNIMLGEESHMQKDKGGMFSLTCERTKHKHYHIYIYRENMFPKWDHQRRLGEEGKRMLKK